MQSQPNVSDPIVPSVSLVIKLASSADQQFVGSVKAAGLPATWIVEQPRQARLFADGQLAVVTQELAAPISARTPQRLRAELGSLQAAVREECGQQLRVVVGDPQQLRSRAAMLADLGIEAVIADSQLADAAKQPRPLPCGLWQFDPGASVPQPRRRWAILPSRRLSVRRLIDAGVGHTLVAIDLQQTSMRELQGCEALLRELGEASRANQLVVATLSQAAGELASRVEAKPQRSILRRVA